MTADDADYADSNLCNLRDLRSLTLLRGFSSLCGALANGSCHVLVVVRVVLDGDVITHCQISGLLCRRIQIKRHAVQLQSRDLTRGSLAVD